MNRRTWFSVGAVIVMAWLMVDGAAHEPAAQAREQRSTPDPVSRRPNLEGVWAYGTSTPLERPQQFANQPYFSSDAEADQFRTEAEAARRAVQASRLGVPEFGEDEQPVEADRGGKPTSLITGPANGRIPY